MIILNITKSQWHNHNGMYKMAERVIGCLNNSVANIYFDLFHCCYIKYSVSPILLTNQFLTNQFLLNKYFYFKAI